MQKQDTVTPLSIGANPHNAKTQAKLDNPTTVVGERHNEMNGVILDLVGNRVPDPEIFSAMKARYPKADKEINDSIKGAHARNPTPSRGRALGPLPQRPLSARMPAKVVLSTMVDNEPAPLPAPLANGYAATIQFLRAVFKEGESICITNACDERDGKFIPSGKGTFKAREEWEAWFVDPAAGKKANRLDGPAGAWVRVNPCKDESATDTGISDFRHVLVEFDDGKTLAEQWSILKASGLPIAAVMTSGGKSVHAWVTVGAASLEEFKARREAVYSFLSAHNPDPASKNPSRLSRLPGVLRNGSEQTLYALGIGAASWNEWADDQSKSPLIPEVKPFPLHTLPGQIGDMARAISDAERTPVALAACCVLGFLSGALGRGFQVQSGADRWTRGNLFIIASAESGSGKSESFRHAAAPFRLFESERLEHWTAAILPCIQSEIGMLEQEILKLKKEAQSGKGDREEIKKALTDKNASLAKSQAMLCAPSLAVEDVTTEKLAAMLAENDETLMSSSPDAGNVVNNIFGRYMAKGNSGQRTDEALYLKAFSGDNHRVDRVKNPAPILLKNPCLSALWLTQPEKVEALFGERQLTEGGLMPRFLVCDTQAKPIKIIGNNAGIPAEVEAAYRNRIRELLTTYRCASLPLGTFPHDDASAFLNAHFNRNVDRQAGDLSDVKSYVARWTEQAWRIAVCLHAAEHGSRAHQVKLSADTASRAIELADWFSEQQLSILDLSRESSRQLVWEKVRDLLANHPLGIRARDVQRARIARTADEANTLLSAMEAASALVGRDEKPEAGGHISRVFTLPSA